MLNQLRIKTTHALEKIFLDRAPKDACSHASVLKNEQFSFQVAYTAEEGWIQPSSRIPFTIESPLADAVTVYQVQCVPSVMPTYPRVDDDYERSTPGLYPDRLDRLDTHEIKVWINRWRSLWISVSGEPDLPAGQHEIRVVFWDPVDRTRELGEAVFTLSVIDAHLPDQSLIYTNWFHADCLASIYQVDALSETHWEHMEQFIAMAARFGMNMILTPCFTPPLDTPVGSERMTVQLISIQKKDKTYTFDFRNLDRWISLCKRCGIQYFEHSHLFTQWGAKHAPKIIVCENGEYRRLFGWDTDAGSEAYRGFLGQYLKALREHLVARHDYERFYFHISDEPRTEHLESYAKARAIVRESLGEKPVFDALSELDFYEQGLVDIPVPVTRVVDQFIGKAPELWTYYTGYQSFSYANRLMALASRRNRILGTQLYAHDIKGFLHWAYNFYYTTLSREVCNPYESTDAYGEFPSGTAFMVYPGPDGPVPSLRLFVFHDGLQDMRALKLLESKIGREAVMELIQKHLGSLSFQSSPHSDAVFLHFRSIVNEKIRAALDQD